MKTLPSELTTAQMCMLLGISKQHLGRFEKDGIVEKLGKDRFSLHSVARVFEHMRNRSAGPKAWNAARTRKMEADAARAENELRRSRGEMIPVADMKKGMDLMASMAKTLFLASPSRMAPRLARARTPAECLELLLRENRMILQKIGDSKWQPVKTDRGTFTVDVKFPDDETADKAANPRFHKTEEVHE
jgi:hypothetical protein